MELGIGIGIIGILIGILIAVYHGRVPNVIVTCKLIQSGDPSIIECTAINAGLVEAKDIYIGFNNMLPIGTTLFSKPEHGLELHESNLPPDPASSPHASLLTRAFSVRIPRIAGKNKEVTFQVKTVDPDNQRAAKQILKIRNEIQDILQAFGDCINSKHSEESKKWNMERILQAREKQENFFTPGHFSYEKGQFPISFLKEEEQLAIANNQDIYSRFKKEHLEVFQGRQKFKAPVVRIKTAHGESTYAIFPPYVNTYTEKVLIPKQMPKGTVLFISPPVPPTYD